MRRLLHILLIISSLQILIVGFTKASHFMGGEITWQCLENNGKYRFEMRLYRECGANAVYYEKVEIINIINYPTLGMVTKIRMGLDTIIDNSPVCNPAGPKISCATASQANMGAVTEYLYTSDSLYPSGVTLSGIPPAQGWIFSYKSPGINKRNPSDNINLADLKTWALRAVMYPYKDEKGVLHNANPCYDNSPTFAEKPSTVICTGYHFTYNPNAYDNEFDSLVYHWASPLDSSMNVINDYAPTFSFSNPLPGISLNPQNIPGSIDLHTGEISFKSLTQGAFLTVSRVTAYKNKVRVAEIYREMQIVLLGCGNNIPPDVTPPFKAGTSYIDTVYAGQAVSFRLLSTDDATQRMTVNATGADFGAGFSSTTMGCLTPPCATLTPSLPMSGTGQLSTDFFWQTTCDHLTRALEVGSGKTNLIFNKPTQSNVHNFVISVQDDYCPVPGKNVSTITVVILNKPILSAPSLRCASVDQNGDVTLSWVPPIDTSGSFYCYYLYYSEGSSGSFVLLDSIFNPLQASYFHVGANAKTQQLRYYLVTRSGCHSIYYSMPSDTLSSIFLLAKNTGNGTAVLRWNHPHEPPLPTTSSDYIIYREYPPGNWSMLTTASNIKTEYTDTISVCNSFINYRIELEDSSGCRSLSNVSGEQFSDKTPPPIPVIDTVSVDTMQKKTIIGWQQTQTRDAKGYIIYRYINNVWTPIDTIKDAATTSYTSSKSQPYNGSESYCVAVFDSCSKLSPLSLPHATIFLSLQLNVCEAEVTLKWNEYKNMKALSGYSIYVSENNSGYQMIHSQGANLPTQYLHTGLKAGTNYCYLVKAYDATGRVTSLSNINCIYSIVSRKPSYAYIRYATVVEGGGGYEDISLRFIADSTAYISRYVINRGDSSGLNFEAISSIPANGLYDMTYTDREVFPSQQSYSYMVEVYDSCGKLAVRSNIGRSILLRGMGNGDLTNRLTWIPYIAWDGEVSSYVINRAIGTTGIYQQLSQQDPLLPEEYTDDISMFTLGEGYFVYYVVAREAAGSIFPFADSSRSNKVIVLQQPKYFVPNAFNPKKGIKKEFVPIGIFNNTGDYYFAVFSRWGARVFETNTPNSGWDGYINGKLAPQGIYAYILRYRDSAGKQYIKKGSVMLLR